MKGTKVFATLAVMVSVLTALESLSCATAGGASESSPQDEKVLGTSKDKRGFETRHTEVDQIYQTAKQFMEAGQFEKAAVELEKVVAADIGRLEALHDLGKCYSELSAFDKAAAAYAKAAAAHPGDQRILTNLGYYQMRADDFEGAMATYDKILEATPDDYEANRWTAFLHEKKGEKEDALAHYERALKVKPDDVKTMGSIAKLHGEMGQKDKALAIYEQAIGAATPEEAIALKAQLGKMYLEGAQYDKAAPMFEALVKAQPENASYRYNLGASLLQLDRPAEAVAHLEKARELGPDFCPTYQQLAMAYNGVKRYGDAIKAAEGGVGKCESGKQAGLYYMWGQALEGLGRHHEAIDKFQKCVGDPTFGAFAQKQIKRQEDLIKRAKAAEEQSGY